MESLWELKELIANKKYKVISFDIFDTLLLRPSVYPTDILALAGRKAGSSEFYLNLRRNCERLARTNNNVMSEDIRFENIFSEMSDKYTFSKQEIESLMHNELDCEFDLLKPRKAIKEIFDYAKGIGKTVIITSDIYLSEQFIGKVLDNCGYTGFEKLYVSSEYGMTKSSGRLFARVIMDYKSKGISASEILHLGDNERSDIAAAEKAGLSTIHVPRVEALAHKDNRFKRLEMFSERSCDNTFLMGCSINRIFDDPYVPVGETSFLDNIQNVSITVIAPMLVSFVKWIVSDCKTNDKKHLIFFNSEGEFVQKMVEMVKPYIFPELETSRVSFGNRLRRYLNTDFVTLFAKQELTEDDKIKTVSRVLLLSDADEQVMKLFGKYGYNSMNDAVGTLSVLYDMADELNTLFNKKREQEINAFWNNIRKYGNAAFYTNKLRNDLAAADTSTDMNIYSIVSGTDAPQHNCKSLGQMGLNVRRTLPLFPVIIEKICDFNTETNEEPLCSVCADVISYAGDFLKTFGERINLMHLNAYQYFEFLKIAMLEYPDFPTKELTEEGEKK